MTRPRPGVAIGAHIPESTWLQRGLCRGMPADTFYPTERSGAEVAKKICFGCVVRPQCLEYALENRERFGVWGGTSDHERRTIWKTRTGGRPRQEEVECEQAVPWVRERDRPA